MSGTNIPDEPSPARGPNPTRIYIILAAVLVLVIVAVGAILIANGIPAVRRDREPTRTPPIAIAEFTPTLNPTFTPRPTREPVATLPPTAVPPPAVVMADTDAPVYEFVSAGGRPSAEWTGFFGQVVDAQSNPLPGVSLVVWYPEGSPASSLVQTDETGSYELRLGEGAISGIWTIQVLTDDLQPASKLFSFQTDDDTAAGIQQIQVIWQRAP